MSHQREKARLFYQEEEPATTYIDTTIESVPERHTTYHYIRFSRELFATSHTIIYSGKRKPFASSSVVNDKDIYRDG